MYYIYMLRCEDNSIYTGITNNLERRMEEHFLKNEKCAKYTITHKAKQLEKAWWTYDKVLASKLEYHIKKDLSKKQKEELIKSNNLEILKEKIENQLYFNLEDKCKIIIRQVKKEDYKDIYELVKEAFRTAEISDGKEQEFVNELRERNSYIRHLEFVAEENGKLIGHVMLTTQEVENGIDTYTGLLLAPICVKLEYRNKGIGTKLIKYGFSKALDMGYKAVFLVGNMKYYNRFGFRKVTEFGIKNISKISDEFILGCELKKGELENIKGEINIK